MFNLRVVGGDMDGTRLSVDDELLIGRDAEGAGNLGGDPEISRSHARMRRLDDGTLLIEDLGSTNGTFVNGVAISRPHVLEIGDRIKIGRTTLEATGETAPDDRAKETLAAPLRTSRGSPAAPLPPFSPPPSAATENSRRSPGVAVLVLGAAALALAGATAYLLVDRKSGGGTAAAAAASFDGVVYVESNLAAANANGILAFRYRNGSFRPLGISEYPTGGAGSADLTDSGVLDADQQLIVNPQHTLLFAVNQGSDSIAVMRIAADGALTPVAGSPFSSGGAGPASLGLDGDTLVVVNKAQDGIRDLKAVQPNYTTFRVGGDGTLHPGGSTVAVPAGSSPTQALITREHVVISTEEAGPFRAFRLEGATLEQGPNSPLAPDESIFPPNFPKEKKWALGLGVYPTKPILYAQMATVGKLAVYSYDEQGRLTFLRAVDNVGSELPCWTLISSDGRRLYTANAGNNTLSVFDIGTDPMRPRQLQNLKLSGGGNPWNVTFDSSERYIFLVEPRAVDRVPPGQGNLLHTLQVNGDGTLTEIESSPVPLPVPLNTNPIGIAAVPRR